MMDWGLVALYVFVAIASGFCCWCVFISPDPAGIGRDPDGIEWLIIGTATVLWPLVYIVMILALIIFATWSLVRRR